MHQVRRAALAAALLLLTGVSAGCTAEAPQGADKPVPAVSAATPPREIVATTTTLWTESTPKPGTTGVVVLQVVAA